MRVQDQPEVVVLWLERAIDGTASRAHLDGTLSRLERVELSPVKTIYNAIDSDGAESVFRKTFRLARLVLSGAGQARSNRVLFARFHPLLLPVQCAWKLSGGRTVVSVQGSLEDMKAEGNSVFARLPLVRWLSIRSMKMADALIVGNPTIVEHVRRIVGDQEIVVIPNGVFTDDMRTASQLPRPHAGPYAVYVGNFASWQGIETLLSATEATEWPVGLPLVIVGDGSLRELVQASQGGVVRWVGQQPSDMARAFLAHAEFAFSLKRSDTPTAKHGYWPFKLLESAAVGTPIIVSNAPGMEDAAAKLGNAIIVPSEDPRAAAQAASRLDASPSLREKLSESGVENVGAFDWRSGARELERVILSVWK